MITNSATSTISDTRAGYGLVSRSLHWVMAALFIWQFTSALLHALLPDTPVEGFFWSTHYSVGFTLCVLAILRGAWGLVNLRQRPRYGSSFLERAAALGHLSMYILMIIVPSIAIVRAIGNTRGLSVYGIQLAAPGGEANPWLTAPANLAHGLLGWALLALIVGHIVMALLHSMVWQDPTLDRMTKGWSTRQPRTSGSLAR